MRYLVLVFYVSPDAQLNKLLNPFVRLTLSCKEKLTDLIREFSLQVEEVPKTPAEVKAKQMLHASKTYELRLKGI